MLIACLLFGLCLIERKAKERMNIKTTSPVTSNPSINKYNSLAQKVVPRKKRPVSSAADTTEISAVFRAGALWKMPLNATILANP
jgi:hypothetical protein